MSGGKAPHILIFGINRGELSPSGSGRLNTDTIG